MNVDLLDGDLYAGDPYPTYAWLRADAPVYRDELNDLWGISRYEDVHDIECQIARGRTECRIAPLTENGLVSRIHGHDAIARQL